jgi:hypothetical protein
MTEEKNIDTEVYLEFLLVAPALAPYSRWVGSLAIMDRLYVNTFSLSSFFWPLLFFEYSV